MLRRQLSLVNPLSHQFHHLMLLQGDSAARFITAARALNNRTLVFVDRPRFQDRFLKVSSRNRRRYCLDLNPFQDFSFQELFDTHVINDAFDGKTERLTLV